MGNFHKSVREMTLTFFDYIEVIKHEVVNLMNEMIEFNPKNAMKEVENTMDSCTIQFPKRWILEKLKDASVADAKEDEVETHLHMPFSIRVYLLHLVGSTIFSDKIHIHKQVEVFVMFQGSQYG